MPSTFNQRNDASIDEKVAFLRRPDSYPSKPQKVDVIETHMSWVFLTDQLVYKLKKPVRREFLDFSTVEARHRNCEREVQLNQRLGARVDYGIVPLNIQPDGCLQLEGKGTVADWLVKMRRLPDQHMLDAAISNGTVSAADIRRLGNMLIDFYGRSTPVGVSAVEYRERFEDDIQANDSELSKPHYRLPVSQVGSLTLAQQDFLVRYGDQLARRTRDRKIVDAHGDLRPEHICLTPEPVIIDCLEFKREFRLLDPVDELAYLAMECGRLGAAHVGDQVMRQYLETTGDSVPEELIWFYKTFRACLRAKIAIWHIADHEVRDTDKWRRRAFDYLELAESYVRHW
jgi:aminoglycoside phosphotransferase family enzyme